MVYMPRFKKSARTGGQNFLARVFLQEELENQEVSHLAGVFAAKEAVMKALGMNPGSWHDIKIIHKPSGEPAVKILTSRYATYNSSLSISHDGSYIIACFVALTP